MWSWICEEVGVIFLVVEYLGNADGALQRNTRIDFFFNGGFELYDYCTKLLGCHVREEICRRNVVAKKKEREGKSHSVR